jgi:phosphoribosylaminoimidazole-succinocarboxamide synthase
MISTLCPIEEFFFITLSPPHDFQMNLKLIGSGKVRDIYEIDDSKLLLVASDRISAFDCIMKTLVPNKGKILTQLSVFWFKMLQDIPNHLVTTDLSKTEYNEFDGRGMVNDNDLDLDCQEIENYSC